MVTQEFDFSNPVVDQVDESVTVTDSMGGTLGTVIAADGSKTFTYTKTIGPYTAAAVRLEDGRQHGHLHDGRLGYGRQRERCGRGHGHVRAAATAKCALPSLAWKLIGLLGELLRDVAAPEAGYVRRLEDRRRHLDAPRGWSILFKEWISSNLVDLLSTELLAAKLNAASGRTSPRSRRRSRRPTRSWRRTTLELALDLEKNQVKAWTITLEAYNNQCIPDIGHGDHD